MFGRRNRIALSSPCATAASAGSSQLPRWLAKISAGLPSSLSLSNNSTLRGSISMRLGSGWSIEVPDVIEMSELSDQTADIVPDTGEDGVDLLG